MNKPPTIGKRNGALLRNALDKYPLKYPDTSEPQALAKKTMKVGLIKCLTLCEDREQHQATDHQHGRPIHDGTTSPPRVVEKLQKRRKQLRRHNPVVDSATQFPLLFHSGLAHAGM